MAEWTGPKRAERGVGDRRGGRRTRDPNDPPGVPEAPGAVTSPQQPGEVPDRSTVPGEFSVRVPAAKQVRRPLTEYGTAQAIMNVFAPPADNPMDPARFEQATAAYEELRKAYPAELPPESPAPGYALAEGDRMASELQAIDAGPTPSAPDTARGEAYSASPGAPSPDAAAVAPPARTDALAAQVGSTFSPSDAPASARSPSDAAAGSGAVADGGAAGQSRWAEAAPPPKPGDASGPAGTLPAAKDGQTTDEGDNRGGQGSPPVAPQ